VPVHSCALMISKQWPVKIVVVVMHELFYKHFRQFFEILVSASFYMCNPST